MTIATPDDAPRPAPKLSPYDDWCQTCGKPMIRRCRIRYRGLELCGGCFKLAVAAARTLAYRRLVPLAARRAESMVGRATP